MYCLYTAVVVVEEKEEGMGGGQKRDSINNVAS